MKTNLPTTTFTAIGQTYGQFLVTNYCPLPELQAVLIELIHQPTGATIMHIAKEDPENLFCLSFQTLPTSSNGVAHILEHTVLCGSKKYSVRDPFFSMTRRSLHTFMNAFTGQDFTCYPASSQVEQDFYNLLDVYLDAVFHPQLRKMSFLQEGHRLEFSTPTDSTSPLQFQGVVYNEMKGAFASPDARMWDEISKRLLPDLPYAHNSGGDPQEIPHLSYEELLEFHRTYYHPSRCIFFFYGDIPLEKHLDFIQQNALSGVAKLPPLPAIPLQPRFKEPVWASAYYPNESKDSQTQVAFAWLTTPSLNQTDILALLLLECFLLETDASPLKIALLKSGLCKDIDSMLDVEMSEATFTVICHGCDETADKALKEVLFNTLHQIATSPIDPTQLEAALHQLELERTEIGGEGGPFGLTLFMRAGLIKHHGNDPEKALTIHAHFDEIRTHLKNPAYIPSLIKTYFLDNTHLVIQKLIPDPELGQKEKAAEQAKLKQIQDQLTSAQKEQIVQQAAELLKAQEESEHQSIDCLPKVHLRDIPKETKDFPLEKISLETIDIYYSECFTNGLVYADFLFDLPYIAEADLPLLSLLANVWTELGCGGRDYEENLQFMQAYTGGVDAQIALHVDSLDSNKMRPAFSLRGKALARNIEPFFQLLYDFARGPDFSDQARLKEWLAQHASELETDLVDNSKSYATQLSLSGYSLPGFCYNQFNGFAYHQFVLKLAKDKTASWINRLAALAAKLCTGKPHLILGCEKKELLSLQENNFYLLGTWAIQQPQAGWKADYNMLSPSSQARLISAPVAFTSMGLKTATYKDPAVAELMLASLILKHVVLHKEIREKGGAYGGGASYSPITGHFHFTAYRDPNLSTSIAAFKRSIELIAAGEFSERELEEAKISLIGSIDTPVVPCGKAVVAYGWLRANRSVQARQTLRNQILAATKNGVAVAVKTHLQDTPSTVVSFLGKELWQKEQSLVDLTLIKES